MMSIFVMMRFIITHLPNPTGHRSNNISVILPTKWQIFIICCLLFSVSLSLLHALRIDLLTHQISCVWEMKYTRNHIYCALVCTQILIFKWQKWKMSKNYELNIINHIKLSWKYGSNQSIIHESAHANHIDKLKISIDSSTRERQKKTSLHSQQNGQIANRPINFIHTTQN